MAQVVEKRKEERRAFEVNLGPAMRSRDAIKPNSVTVTSTQVDDPDTAIDESLTIVDISSTRKIITFYVNPSDITGRFELTINWTTLGTTKLPEQNLQTSIFINIK